jgi:putative FmdB family regulatory protein
MPLYEYVCLSCAARFEKLVRRFGEPVTCPSCAGGMVDKQLSVFAVASSSAAPFAGAGCETACAADALGGCGEGGCGGGACDGGACRLPG